MDEVDEGPQSSYDPDLAWEWRRYHSHLTSLLVQTIIDPDIHWFCTHVIQHSCIEWDAIRKGSG